MRRRNVSLRGESYPSVVALSSASAIAMTSRSTEKGGAQPKRMSPPGASTVSRRGVAMSYQASVRRSAQPHPPRDLLLVDQVPGEHRDLFPDLGQPSFSRSEALLQVGETGGRRRVLRAR